MESKRQKGLKSLMIKTLAVIMGMCYVLNPLHDQVLTVFHSLSHALEIPHGISSLTEFDFFENHHHHHGASNVGHEHGHDHDVINFLSSIFKESNKEHESPKSLSSEIELDKHFFSSEYRIREPLDIHCKSDFFAIVRKCLVGHSRELYAPPKNAA